MQPLSEAIRPSLYGLVRVGMGEATWALLPVGVVAVLALNRAWALFPALLLGAVLAAVRARRVSVARSGDALLIRNFYWTKLVPLSDSSVLTADYDFTLGLAYYRLELTDTERREYVPIHGVPLFGGKRRRNARAQEVAGQLRVTFDGKR